MTPNSLFPIQKTATPWALLDTTIWKMLLPSMSRSWPTPPSYNTRGYVEFLTKVYNRPEFFERPESFYKPASRPPRVEITKVRDLPNGGEVVDLCFDSNYEAFFEEYADHASLYPENTKVHARWYRSSEPRKTVIAIHGLGNGQYLSDSATFDVMRWWNAGLDVILPILPHHGPRRTTSAPKWAMMWPSSDLVRTNESFRQAVWDIRNLIHWLEVQSVPSFGLFGFSLGGYLAALLSCLVEGLEFAWLLCPAASIAETMWLSREKNQSLQVAARSGVTWELTDALFAVHSPLKRECLIPKGRRHLILAKDDKIAPIPRALELWEHWDRPNLKWLWGGHVAQIGRDRAYDALEQWLQDAGITSGTKRSKLSSLIRSLSMPAMTLPGLQLNMGEIGAETMSRFMRRPEQSAASSASQAE